MGLFQPDQNFIIHTVKLSTNLFFFYSAYGCKIVYSDIKAMVSDNIELSDDESKPIGYVERDGIQGLTSRTTELIYPGTTINPGTTLIVGCADL